MEGNSLLSDQFTHLLLEVELLEITAPPSVAAIADCTTIVPRFSSEFQVFFIAIVQSIVHVEDLICTEMLIRIYRGACVRHQQLKH